LSAGNLPKVKEQTSIKTSVTELIPTEETNQAVLQILTVDLVVCIMASTALFNSLSFTEASVKTKMSDDEGACVSVNYRSMKQKRQELLAL